MFNFVRFRWKNVLIDHIERAVRENKLQELRTLLSNNEAKRRIRKTGGKVLIGCLRIGIRRGHYECIEELLKAGAYSNTIDNYYAVFDRRSASSGIRILKLLSDYGADPDPPDSEYHNPLYVALNNGALDCFRMLLLYGADPDFICSHYDSLKRTSDYISVLGMCLKKDYEAQFVNLLIQFGANMYSPDIQKLLLEVDNDATQLLSRERDHPISLISQCRIAIRRNLKQVGKLCLIDQLKIPNNLLRYLQFHNELHYPEKLPRTYISRYQKCFLNYFPSLYSETLRLGSHSADLLRIFCQDFEAQNQEWMQRETYKVVVHITESYRFFMLKHRGEEDGHAESCKLYLAVRSNKPQQLSELLCQGKYKEYIDSRSGWGVPVTPLRLAASQGSLECVKILLANGAEVDCLDAKAQTPLFVAVGAGHFDCVRELLKAGANPCGSVYNNCPPVLIASRDGHNKILKELLDFGADANINSRKASRRSISRTCCTGPLYLAAVYGNLECFRTLLLYGAEPNYNCTYRNSLTIMKYPVSSILETCLKHGCSPEFVNLLIEFGAHMYIPNISALQPLAHSCSLELLEREREYPRSLMSQCRLTIRRRLIQLGRLRLIDKLNIPQRILKYLQHQNEILNGDCQK